MQGKLIVLEGIDGSGKSTQFARLCERLTAEGTAFQKLVFPRYDKPSSALIRMYLGGEFGEKAGDVNPYMASSFFAVDRCASYLNDWKDAYQSGALILSDRYTTANAVHQGSKLPQTELPEFLDWLADYEYGRLGLPRPDAVLYMDIDTATAMQRMRERQEQTNTHADIHEADERYLLQCLRAGDYAASHYGWKRIQCLSGGTMRSVEELHEEIWQTVQALLG